MHWHEHVTILAASVGYIHVQDTPAMGIILCMVVKPKFTFWLIQVVPPILVVCVRSCVVCCDNYEKMTVFGPKRDTKATKHENPPQVTTGGS